MASETIWVDLKAAAEGIGVKQNRTIDPHHVKTVKLNCSFL